MKFDSLVNQIIEASVIRRSPLYTSINKGENIIAAAIHDKRTNNTYTGDSHFDAFETMQKEEKYNFPVNDEQTFEYFRDRGDYYDRFVDGFYTNRNRFLTRKEALEFMKLSHCPVDKEDLKYGKELHSNVVQQYQQACAQ